MHGDGVCDMACAGDGDEICGGDFSVSVYESDVEAEPVDPAEPSTSFSYIGCYADMPEPDRCFVVALCAVSLSLCVLLGSGTNKLLLHCKTCSTIRVVDFRFHRT